MNARMTPESTPTQQALRSELLENAAVRVIETTYPKGGSVTTLEVRPGQALWRDTQSHGSRNIGPTAVRIVEVEIKNSVAGAAGPRTPLVATDADRDWIRDPLDPRRSTALFVGDPTMPGSYTVRTRADAGYAITSIRRRTRAQSTELRATPRRCARLARSALCVG